jgi:hypothetical protein
MNNTDKLHRAVDNAKDQVVAALENVKTQAIATADEIGGATRKTLHSAQGATEEVWSDGAVFLVALVIREGNDNALKRVCA